MNRRVDGLIVLKMNVRGKEAGQKLPQSRTYRARH